MERTDEWGSPTRSSAGLSSTTEHQYSMPSVCPLRVWWSMTRVAQDHQGHNTEDTVLFGG
jgi:hypothetical protein